MINLRQTRSDKPRWLRFSLRTLLLFITALGIWLGIQVNAARRQRDVVDTIHKFGGMVTYDYQTVPIPGKPEYFFDIDLKAKHPTPQWLRGLVGEEFFRNPVRMILTDRSMTEAEFAEFGELCKLRFVSLDGIRIRNSTSALTRPIGDAELELLSRLNGLRFVDVEHAKFSAAGLAHLAKFELNRLMLVDSNIDDDGMREIGKITSLGSLRLHDNPFTDLGIAHVQSLKRLISLDLSKTGVSDEGLKHLAGLTSLQFVRLEATQVTAEGVAELRKALPKATILGP